jgi:hypothetical protein
MSAGGNAEKIGICDGKETMFLRTARRKRTLPGWTGGWRRSSPGISGVFRRSSVKGMEKLNLPGMRMA